MEIGLTSTLGGHGLSELLSPMLVNGHSIVSES